MNLNRKEKICSRKSSRLQRIRKACYVAFLCSECSGPLREFSCWLRTSWPEAGLRITRRGLFFVMALFLISCGEKKDEPSVTDGISQGNEINQGATQPQGSQPPYIDGNLKDDEYTVVLGSYETDVEARQFIHRLREERINAFLHGFPGSWHVCVGKYHTKSRAQRLQKQMWQLGYYDASVMGPGF